MKTKKGTAKRVILIVSLLISFLFISAFCVIGYFYNKYDLDVNKLTSVNNGVKVYSARGTENTLYNTNRSIVEIETLPEYVKQAFVSVEDKRFYSHNGYDLKRIVKAGLVNLTSGSKSQGASTISQQLIKNALLTNEKTYSRKIKEIVLSVKMEKQFSKDEILEMYLNTIYFGSNAYGIENASLTYFNKSAKDLTLNEACCLAGLIKSPNYYSPKLNAENANKRKNLVASLMLNENSITQADYEGIVNENIQVINNTNLNHSYEEEAIYEACKLLNINERELINSNYEIITFKDDNLQNEIININNNVLGTDLNLDSLSVVANNQGHVVAYYANSKYDLHNLTRQPASTLKPLAVYLPCLAHNILSPASQILDEEINYNGFSPKNADSTYHGYVSCEYALANSLNVPAVKLLDSVGFKKSKETLASLGINITNADLNLSLALGATKNGVKVLDLLAAYSTLANMGKYNQLCFVNKILDENGKVIYSHENYGEQVLDKSDCFLLNKMLKQTAKTGTAKRLNSLNLPLASKTGTAGSKSGNTDLYNVTYSTEHAMLSWIADIKNTYLPTNYLSSVQPTEINKQICKALYSDSTPADFAQPETVVKMPYSLVELENNHIIVTPQANELERYIAYDYFKVNNTPKENKNSINVNLCVELSNNGANISFKAEKNKKYCLYKQINNQAIFLKEISETNNEISYLDYNIFKQDEITYYLTDQNGSIITEIIKVRPKDYLINKLNNELISTKKKWYV